MNRYEALRHAVKAHGATTDKCGALYVLHPIAVARAVERCPNDFGNEDAVVVALLHDVWEDTDYDLPTGDMRVSQYRALQAVTKLPDETYAEYITRICECPHRIAIIVKLADLWHNLQPARQRCLPEYEQHSLERRYLRAREELWDALDHEWWPDKQYEAKTRTPDIPAPNWFQESWKSGRL